MPLRPKISPATATDHGPAPPAGAISGPFAAARLRGDAGQELPLSGLTVLAVEDSRFASEALRLVMRRAGARLRRAETLVAAKAHLRVYRPDVMLVDLGLPDGRGEGLIREIVTSLRRPTAVLGLSGDPSGRASALAAGADGFLEKPLEDLAHLCRALRGLMPEHDLHASTFGPTTPDPLALQDDLAYAAQALQGDIGPERRHYLSGFLRGLARQTGDAGLAEAATSLRDESALDPVRQLLLARQTGEAAFKPV